MKRNGTRVWCMHTHTHTQTCPWRCQKWKVNEDVGVVTITTCENANYTVVVDIVMPCHVHCHPQCSRLPYPLHCVVMIILCPVGCLFIEPAIKLLLAVLAISSQVLLQVLGCLLSSQTSRLPHYNALLCFAHIYICLLTLKMVIEKLV